MNSQFSFIVITYNEEVHLPRLLGSIKNLDAAVFVLDSGSMDGTLEICEKYGATVMQHAFENHPKQWDYALKSFKVQTPWVICLDADQIVTPELEKRLADFRDADHRNIDGIYFNRKNFFKGRWIKHGGYYPLYLLKMIRYGTGYSDLNENMDHRFIVPGEIAVWKNGHLLEENLKENNIRFWIEKHNRYSDLVAQEEMERMMQLRTQTIKPRFWGSPDERTASLKQVWWKMPRYVRPLIYFFHRMFFQLGILDGRTGIIFHFLQAFWFRLVVDIKIDELFQARQTIVKTDYNKRNEPIKFLVTFVLLFVFFYFFNVLYYAFTAYGKYANGFVKGHLNYIAGLRRILLFSSEKILHWFGYQAITNDVDLLVPGHGTLRLIYSCLGLGVISFFAAFVLSYPKSWKRKIVFLITGILGIEALNILRFVFLAIFWDKHETRIIDHHTAFNIFIYIVIALALYFWVKSDNPAENAPN